MGRARVAIQVCISPLQAASRIMSAKCKLCQGTRENKTGIEMKVNNDICQRCGSYGTVPNNDNNSESLTEEDHGYIDNNGRVE